MYPQDRGGEIPAYVPPEASAALIEYRIVQLEKRVGDLEQKIDDAAQAFTDYKLDVLGAKDTTFQNLLIGPIVSTLLSGTVTWLLLRVLAPPGGH